MTEPNISEILRNHYRIGCVISRFEKDVANKRQFLENLKAKIRSIIEASMEYEKRKINFSDFIKGYASSPLTDEKNMKDFLNKFSESMTKSSNTHHDKLSVYMDNIQTEEEEIVRNYGSDDINEKLIYEGYSKALWNRLIDHIFDPPAKNDSDIINHLLNESEKSSKWYMDKLGNRIGNLRSLIYTSILDLSSIMYTGALSEKTYIDANNETLTETIKNIEEETKITAFNDLSELKKISDSIADSIEKPTNEGGLLIFKGRKPSKSDSRLVYAKFFSDTMTLSLFDYLNENEKLQKHVIRRCLTKDRLQNSQENVFIISTTKNISFMATVVSPGEKTSWISALCKTGERKQAFSTMRNLLSSSKRRQTKEFSSLNLSLDGENNSVMLRSFLNQRVFNKYIDRINKSIREEGLYRISGDIVFTNDDRETFDKKPDELDKLDVHSVTQIFKKLLQINDPLFSFELYDELCNLDDVNLDILKPIIEKIKYKQRVLLAMLLTHLKEVTKNSDFNKMSIRNISIVFAPILIRPEVETLSNLGEMGRRTVIIDEILKCEDINEFFNIDTETNLDSSTHDLSDIEKLEINQSNDGIFASKSAPVLNTKKNRGSFVGSYAAVKFNKLITTGTKHRDRTGSMSISITSKLFDPYNDDQSLE